jgi:hypothetical protein
MNDLLEKLLEQDDEEFEDLFEPVSDEEANRREDSAGYTIFREGQQVKFDMYPAESVYNQEDLVNELGVMEFVSWLDHNGQLAIVVVGNSRTFEYVSIEFADGYLIDGLSDVHVSHV